MPATVIDGSHSDYIRNELGVDARPMPPFRRLRYNIKLESAQSGHIFTILYDRCTLLDTADKTLCQCEVEYLSTRTALPPQEEKVISEMDVLAEWVEQFFSELGHCTRRGAGTQN